MEKHVRLTMLKKGMAVMFRGRGTQGGAAKALGVSCAATGASVDRWPKRVRYVVLPKPKGRGFVSLGPMQAGNGAKPQWTQAADERPAKPLGKRNRRRKRHALTLIGKKVQIVKKPKLKKYAWQTD